MRNHFLAWQHGPVIRPVYDAFRSYGDSPVTGLAEYLDYSSGTTKPIDHDDISHTDADTISRVFESYAPFSTSELRDLSHETGGPWDVVYRACQADKRMSLRIPNDLISIHFSLKKLVARAVISNFLLVGAGRTYNSDMLAETTIWLEAAYGKAWKILRVARRRKIWIP